MINFLFYVRKRLFGKRWMLILNVAVSSLALTLLCVIVTIPQILLHGENTIRKSLADDMSKYGVVRNGGRDVIFNETISDYISDIYNAPEIDSVGTWDYAGFGYLATVDGEADYWIEIMEIQNSHIREFDENSNYVDTVYMLSQAFCINDLELYRGSAEQVGINDGWLMYLGYNFKDIPIGTVFVNEPYGISYTVGGIFQKDTSIVDEQILWNLRNLKLSCSNAMDNMVLVVPPCSVNYHSVDYFFKCADGYTYEEAANKIKSISEKYGIQTETGTLQNRVDTVLAEADWLLNAFTELSILLFLSAFIMLLTTQLLTILFRKDELGVWLISGINRKKIFKILLGENIIKMLISSLISLGVVVLLEKIVITSNAIAYELRYILWVNIPVFLLLCTVLTALLCSVIPIEYVKKKSIPEIVRGTWE